MEVIEGIVKDLDRVTHTSGGSGDTSASTRHISIFKLNNYRVKLSLSSPAMISDGDTIRICGKGSTGEFSAIYCNNITTGWTSPIQRQGCIKAILVLFAMITGLGGLFFKPFLLMTVFCSIIFILISKGEKTFKKAKKLVDTHS